MNEHRRRADRADPTYQREVVLGEDLTGRRPADGEHSWSRHRPRRTAGSGTSVLLLEQNDRMALGLASRGYVLELGRITGSGPSADLTADDSVRKAYSRV